MNNLTKHFGILLLSGFILLIGEIATADYSNPFVPIYSVGDDISRAVVKPTTIYEEVPGSKIVIPNMPAYKTQDELGECRAFSLATILQKYTCDKLGITDCTNPSSGDAISSFGMLAYTNRSIEQANTFQPNQEKARSMYDIITGLSTSGNKLILDSCKSFDTLVNNFSKNGQKGIDDKKKFFDYLQNIYNTRRATTEADIADCPECIAEINKNAGINTNLDSLRKALTKDAYDKFLYSLFFKDCKMMPFPGGFSAVAFPLDSMSVSSTDVKNRIIEGLQRNKPVLFSALCVSQDVGDKCKYGHSIVISGYKKVCSSDNKNICKEVFHVHNSWGDEWQKMNNDGWVDADALTANSMKEVKNSSRRLESGSVIWLEP